MTAPAGGAGHQPTDLQDPQQPPAAAATTDPPTGKIPGWAAALFGLAAFSLLVLFLWRGWLFVVRSDEAREKEDYEQLLGLIDRVDTLATLVLGAVLGFGVGGATAASAATKNKAEAQRQRDLADTNAQVAAHNRDVGRSMRDDVLDAQRFADQVMAVAQRRAADGSRFVDDAAVRRATPVGGDAFRLDDTGPVTIAVAPGLADRDPAFDELQPTAERLGERLRRWR